MTAWHIVIAVAVLLCAVALLYIADHRSLIPTTPQTTSLFQAR